jgi:hypothetical protein
METSTRALHILHALQDLRPEQARSFLREAVSTLDAAELAALRRQLPAGMGPAATELLDPQMMPTVQRTFPMPWEYAPAQTAPTGPSTEQLIRAAVRPGKARTVALAVAGIAAGALLGLGLYRAALRPATPPLAPAPLAAAAATPSEPGASLDPVPLVALVPAAPPRPVHHAAAARTRPPAPQHHEPAHRTSQTVEAARPFPDSLQSALYGTRL